MKRIMQKLLLVTCATFVTGTSLIGMGSPARTKGFETIETQMDSCEYNTAMDIWEKGVVNYQVSEKTDKNNKDYAYNV